MPVDLYACGFNAYGQLTGEELDDEPADLRRFRRIVEQKDNLRLLFAGWADTLLEVNGELILRGFSNPTLEKSIGSDVLPSKVLSGFGDHTGLKGAVTEDGDVLLLQRSEEGKLQLRTRGSEILAEAREYKLRHVTIAGNGTVCVSMGPKILEFPSLDTFLTHRLSTSLFPSSSPSLPTHKQYILPSSPTQLLSAEASFTALLSSTTMVYTWGDARHNHLGRALTPVTPSGTPHVVDFLGGIPIRKILTGGWISGALSTSNDLYLWGGRPGEDQRIAALPDLVHHRDGANEEMVKLVDVDGQERDVLDAGIGAGHVIALTDDGRVWAAGRNQNGQLGVVGRGKKDFNERWVEVELCLEEKAMVERIDCGPWSSFLLIRTET